ncbi:ATPase [Aureococcus anophagefferens]|nr:ATPase [Aureococcus anophagefferens]
MVGRPSAALSSAMFDDKLTEKEREAKGALVEAEFQRKEAIAGSMYRKYLENFGVARFWCTATVCGASYGCFALGDWSLSRWIGILDVDGEEKREDRLESDRAEDAMWLYGIFVLLSAVLLIATSVLFSAGGVRAAKTLHRDCLHRVPRALVPFDATPTGRLTSRFSADLSVVDLQLSFYVDHVFQMSGQILALGHAGDAPRAARELWPSNGSLRFADVTLRYRPGLPPALEHLNLYVEGGTRVGASAARARKSSLVAAFRLVEPGGGRVLIDGLDVAFVGLCALRKRVSMVPQDNVLLSGSVDRTWTL